MSTTVFPESGDQITEAAWTAQNQSLTVAERYRVSGYTLSAGTGLNANVAAGTAVVNGYHIVSDATQAVAVTASQTNYIWLAEDGTLSHNTTGTNPGTDLLLGTAVTDGSGVTSVSHQYNIENSQNVLIVKPSDETVNNSSAFQNDDDFSFPIAAGEVWDVSLFLAVDQANATPDFKMQWDSGGNHVAYNYFWGAQQNSGTAISAGYSTGTMTVDQSANNDLPVRCNSVIVGSGSGTVTLQWAQSSATAANTTVSAGSLMIARRVLG